MNGLRSRILGIGHYVPERVIKNQDLESLLQITDEAIVKRTGVHERRYVEAGTQCTSDLALEAAREALRAAGVEAAELDLLILATLSPDHFFPGTGCFLQAKLGIPGVPALDVRNQCSGFVYGLSIADQFVRTGTYRRVLVVGAEVHSTGLDMTPAVASVSILFGDGAGAAVVGPSEEPEAGLLDCRLFADGRHARELWVEAPGTVTPVQITHQSLDERRQFPVMHGRTVFRAAVTSLCELVQGMLAARQLTTRDVKLFVFHQANLRIVESVVKRLQLEPEQYYNNIQRYGNTTAASIPIALSEALAEGRAQRGDLVMLASFGSGFTWAGALLRW